MVQSHMEPTTFHLGPFRAIATLLLAAFLLLSALLAQGVAVAQEPTTTFCGAVTGYRPASGGAEGSISIGSKSYPIAAGSELIGEELARRDTSVCLNVIPDRSGRMVAYSVTADTSDADAQMVKVCGVVSAYIPATADAPGGLLISDQQYAVAPGTVFADGELLTTSAPVCIEAVLGMGGIVNGAVTRAAPEPAEEPKPSVPEDTRPEAPRDVQSVDGAPFGIPKAMPNTGAGFVAPLASPASAGAYYAGLVAMMGAVALRHRRP